ncbi:uncharacterized protein AKAME5_002561300 [Lates japonicus]|uniref:Uncharacterized protein n=2 Tax=Lates japonicus TaxID=270547 RepID=A0AAD3NNJ4_LATJO|nr:uncharacterized protein AKAME5_002561300 [Lates japonicus]
MIRDDFTGPDVKCQLLKDYSDQLYGFSASSSRPPPGGLKAPGVENILVGPRARDYFAPIHEAKTAPQASGPASGGVEGWVLSHLRHLAAAAGGEPPQSARSKDAAGEEPPRCSENSAGGALLAAGLEPLRSQEAVSLEVGDPGELPLIGFETVETEIGEERGSGVDRKQVFNDQVTPQIAALLDEDMISDDELKVSQKRKSTRSGSSNTKMSRRTVKQSQEGDSDFVLSQESQSLYTATEIKRFLEQTKGLRLITVEEHFPDLKLFLRSAKILTRKSGMTEDVLSDQEIYRLKKHIVKVKSQISSQDDEF